MNTYTSEAHKLHNTAGMTLNGCAYFIDELPERVENILNAVRQNPGLQVFSPKDHGMQPILAVHDADFLAFLQSIYTDTGLAQPVIPVTFAPPSRLRKSTLPEALPGYYCFETLTPILEGTWTAAYWSAQCALSAAQDLLAKRASAYALCRPPGHHAARAMYGGFCYLNNAAIAARYLQNNWPHSQGADPVRVAILDIDYHHGNGTQEIFYTDPSVLYCSLHADPDQDYPYFWGARDELGQGPGYGANRNWPLPKGTTDAEYLAALREALNTIKVYDPACLVVSLGFDTGLNDPVGGFCISPAGFSAIAAAIQAAGWPTLLVQEGGYRLDQLETWAAAFLEPFSR